MNRDELIEHLREELIKRDARIGKLEWLLRDVIETIESTDDPLENNVEYVVSLLVPETTRNEK